MYFKNVYINILYIIVTFLLNTHACVCIYIHKYIHILCKQKLILDVINRLKALIKRPFLDNIDHF